MPGGEKGEVTMEGEMRSRYGGQHCKVAESFASKSNSSVSSPCGADMRGRPSRSRARLRPMLVAPIRSRLKRCPSCPASVPHAGLRHCRSPRISATRPPRGSVGERTRSSRTDRTETSS
eukprot:scaffold403_cov127-Isochrysis_galbana.AAC.7